jgi:hypothetical protein
LTHSAIPDGPSDVHGLPITSQAGNSDRYGPVASLKIRDAVEVELLVEGIAGSGRQRVLYLATAHRFDDWSTELTRAFDWRENDGFALLIVGNAIDVDGAVIADLANWCITHGLFSMSAWGPGCERVHDLFDEVDVIISIDNPVERGDSGDVMTTWHNGETLSEAVEFFWTSSFAARDRIWGPRHIVLVFGSQAWADEVRTLVANFPNA